jgi:hypothetical protein
MAPEALQRDDHINFVAGCCLRLRNFEVRPELNVLTKLSLLSSSISIH